jgi:hypothetical protein
VSHALFFREEKKNTQRTGKATSAKKKKKATQSIHEKKVRSLLSLRSLTRSQKASKQAIKQTATSKRLFRDRFA